MKYVVAAILVLAISSASVYAWKNRATVVHEERHLIGEVEKSRSCTAPGHCHASGYVNGEYKYYYGFHPNCSGSKKVRGIEHQLKRVWSDDDITYDYPFTPIEDITDCSV